MIEKHNFMNIQLFAEEDEQSEFQDEFDLVESEDTSDIESDDTEVDDDSVYDGADEDEITLEDEDEVIIDEDESDNNQGEVETESKQTPDSVETDKDEQIAELTAKLTALEAQSKDTLKKLGVKVDGSLLETLEKAAAEAEGFTVEEYRNQRKDGIEAEVAKLIIGQQKIEEIMAADLIQLKRDVPALINLEHISQMDKFKEFGALRDKGLSVKQAYFALNGNSIANVAEVAARQQSIKDSKKHLTTAAPKKSKDTSISIPKESLAEWRELFPDKSNNELIRLYKNTL